jgi:hypothetical protein
VILSIRVKVSGYLIVVWFFVYCFSISLQIVVDEYVPGRIENFWPYAPSPYLFGDRQIGFVGW